jgi:4-hydroxyphenylpyruvate dioxygenase
MSLGRCFAGHSMPHKLDMARKYGFQGIEVFYEDLVYLTNEMHGGNTRANQLVAATIFRRLCDARHLEIIALQPFMNYEGLRDRSLHEERLDELRLFMQVAHVLRTDLILLPSSILPADQVTDDMGVIVQDMIRVAELGAKETPTIKFAYEALCWGTRINLWEDSWKVVQRVNRPNFGICLDTFNIAGRIFADPSRVSGKTPDANQAVGQSIRNMTSTVQKQLDKVFLVQVADAERLSQPLDVNHPFYNAEQPARMSWSRNARLFYGESEDGAYLPVEALLHTIVNKMAFHGWLSFEVFNRRLAEHDESVPEEMAKRASKSWVKMVEDLGLEEGKESRTLASHRRETHAML